MLAACENVPRVRGLRCQLPTQFLEGPERRGARGRAGATLGAEPTGQGCAGPPKHRERSQCPLSLAMLRDYAP